MSLSTSSLPLYMRLTQPETISIPSLILHLEQNERDAIKILGAVVHSRYYSEFVLALKGDKAQQVIEIVHRALGSRDIDTIVFHEFRKICGRSGLVPSSYKLPLGLKKQGTNPIASGGFGDVYKGTFDQETVAIKVSRVYNTRDLEKLKKQFCKEVLVWKRLSNPYIVRFLGVSTEVEPYCMVSEWMENGNIRRYVRANPQTNRFKLLMDTARGLEYLHSCHVVHGDLKGDNILVDDRGTARLCDFGLTSIAATVNASTTASCFKGSIRWMAPELFDTSEPDVHSTYAADIYSFSMVCIEVFTGKVPFFAIRNDTAVMVKVTKTGSRPDKPEASFELGLTDAMWGLMQDCWNVDPAMRPSAPALLGRMRQAYPGATVLPRISGLDPASKEAVQSVNFALGADEENLFRLRDDNARTVIHILEKAIASTETGAMLQRDYLRTLRALRRRTLSLPESYDLLREGLTRTTILKGSKLADVWVGDYNGQPVVIKALRPVFSLDKLKNMICSEAMAWRQVSHPNIVKFLGVSAAFYPLCTVSELMDQGNVAEYLDSNPGVDRFKLVVNIAHGLAYLHSIDIVHGNLKAKNVLVNRDGVACLADFGLAAVATEALENNSANGGTFLSARWMAPELHETNPESSAPTKMSDIYALSMVILEIYTGKTPFHEYRKTAVVFKIASGERPQRSQAATRLGLSDALWELIVMCWRQDRTKRPTMAYVLQSLSQIAANTAAAQNPLAEASQYLYLPVQAQVSWTANMFIPGHEIGSRPELKPKPSFHKLFQAITNRPVTPRRSPLLAETSTSSSTHVTCVNRSEKVQVDHRIAYLSTKAIDLGQVLQRVSVAIVSKDHERVLYLKRRGVHDPRWSSFALSLEGSSGEVRWSSNILQAPTPRKTYTENDVGIEDGDLYKLAGAGDKLTVWANPSYPGWSTHVKSMSITCTLQTLGVARSSNSSKLPNSFQ